MPNIETIPIKPTIAKQIGAPIEEQKQPAPIQEHVLLDNTKPKAEVLDEDVMKPIPKAFRPGRIRWE